MTDEEQAHLFRFEPAQPGDRCEFTSLDEMVICRAGDFAAGKDCGQPAVIRADGSPLCEEHRRELVKLIEAGEI